MFRADVVFTKSISFVPSIKDIHSLSERFQKLTNDGAELPPTKTRFTHSMSLQEAPWIKYAPIQRTGVHNNAFAFIIDGTEKDGKYPLSVGEKGPSMGMNGILIKFDGEYGPKRYNLFSTYEKGFFTQSKGVLEMLSDFIRFRDENSMDIFRETIRHMQGNIKCDPAYSIVRDVFILCRKANNLKSTGLALESYCQTLDMHTPSANYSIGAPHFQTRVYIKDREMFRKCLAKHGALDEQRISTCLVAYDDVVNGLRESFVKHGYYQKFVRLDELRDQLVSAARQAILQE
jgi:hypothetical protein